MQQVIKAIISIEEFTKRYKETIIPNNLYSKYWEQTVFMGRIKNNKFYFCCKPAYMNTGLSTILKGTIAENRDGCNIEYKFDKFTSTKIIAIIYSSILAFLAIISLICLEFIGIIFVAMSLAILLPILIKTNKRKEVLLRQLMDIVGNDNL